MPSRPRRFSILDSAELTHACVFLKTAFTFKMALSNIQRHRSYGSIRRSAVFRCRIGVDNLGPQDDDMSENHLTLYLLIGNDESVRVDMRPNVNNDYRDFSGRLELRGHDYTLSNGVIEYSDIDAVGCPDEFDAGREMTATSEARTVREFVGLLESAGLASYRFMNLDGKALGCRSWMCVCYVIHRASFV